MLQMLEKLSAQAIYYRPRAKGPSGILNTAYSDIGLGQHWLRQWLVAWWHRAITWTSASVLTNHQWSCVVLPPVMSYELLKNQTREVILKITLFEITSIISQGPIG